MLTYKVVEIKQKTLGIYMTAKGLQNAINTWANVGWTLDRITSGETQGFLHGKDVFLLIFKKEVVIPPDLYLMVDNQSVLASERTLTALKMNRKISPETPACFKGMEQWKPLHMIAPDVVEVLMN